MATLAQTITVIKDRKVVATSKHLVNVFKEAQIAYRERKAELKVEREDGPRDHQFQRRRTPTAPVRGRQHSNSPRRRDEGVAAARPPMERGYSDSFYANDDQLYRRPVGTAVDRNSIHPGYAETELGRRYSDMELNDQANQYYRQYTAGNADDFNDYFVDEALPPPLPVRQYDDETKLRLQMFSVNRILEETNCMQHSAKAIIKHLETNPDALAAVGLALAQISNLLRKMAPGALMAFRGTFPAVIALLLSPEFLIAAGVGIGITVVALGGYKIVKRIKAKKESASETNAEELEVVTADIDNIRTWQRGVPEAELQNIDTNVEGEFITPLAAQQLRQKQIMPAQNSDRKMPWNRSRQGSREPSSERSPKERVAEPANLRKFFKRTK